MKERTMIATPPSSLRPLLWIVVFLFQAGANSAQLVGMCPASAVRLSYSYLECASSTQITTVKGTCDNKRIKDESRVTETCSEFSITENLTFCHGCDNGRAICSDSTNGTIACKDAFEDPICTNGDAGISYEWDSNVCLPSISPSAYNYIFTTCQKGDLVTSIVEANLDCQDLNLSHCVTCDGVDLCTETDVDCSVINSSDATSLSGQKRQSFLQAAGYQIPTRMIWEIVLAVGAALGVTT